jgi:hypothetical protein
MNFIMSCIIYVYDVTIKLVVVLIQNRLSFWEVYLRGDGNESKAFVIRGGVEPECNRINIVWYNSKCLT